MIPDFKRIPEEYRQEYFEKLTLFIKSRVNLLCALSVSLYFFASLAGALLEPEDFALIELALGGVLIAGGLLVLFLNHRVRS